MPEISVSEKILSEDYADLILPVTLSGSYFLNAYRQMGGELLGGNVFMYEAPRNTQLFTIRILYRIHPRL